MIKFANIYNIVKLLGIQLKYFQTSRSNLGTNITVRNVFGTVSPRKQLLATSRARSESQMAMNYMAEDKG